MDFGDANSLDWTGENSPDWTGGDCGCAENVIGILVTKLSGLVCAFSIACDLLKAWQLLVDLVVSLHCFGVWQTTSCSVEWQTPSLRRGSAARVTSRSPEDLDHFQC